jgi:hypothetical protein
MSRENGITLAVAIMAGLFIIAVGLMVLSG